MRHSARMSRIRGSRWSGATGTPTMSLEGKDGKLIRSRHLHIHEMTSDAGIHGGLVSMVTLLAVNLPQMRVMGIRIEFIGFRRHASGNLHGIPGRPPSEHFASAGLPYGSLSSPCPCSCVCLPGKFPGRPRSDRTAREREKPQTHKTAIAGIKIRNCM